MRPLLLVALVSASAWGAAPRFARVGEFLGSPMVEVRAADGWRAAARNQPLLESSRMRTASGERLEVELDEGGMLRLTGDALAELSDYSRLSTRQRITRISVDRGTAYLTGEPAGSDLLVLVMPGAQMAVVTGSRLRVSVDDAASTVAVLEGFVRFTGPGVEIELRRGQAARMAAGTEANFSLLLEAPVLETDSWNEQRDRLSAHPAAAAYTQAQSGAADLDQAGGWVQAASLGMVWKPRVAADWVPFRDGRWEWYGEIGYTWIAKEPWGWLPSHFGRWVQDSSLGWVWSPDRRPSPVFRPGDVYWMRSAGRIAWGPLGPGEAWTGAGRPVYYAPVNTTGGLLATGQTIIEPDGLQAIAGMAFTVAPPSPGYVADRLDALETPLLAAASLLPLATSAVPPVVIPPDPPPPVATTRLEKTPPEVEALPAVAPAPLDTVEAPDQPPAPTFYPVAVYTGVVVIDPPEIDQPHHGKHGSDWTPHPPAVPMAPQPALIHQATLPVQIERPRDRQLEDKVPEKNSK